MNVRRIGGGIFGLVAAVAVAVGGAASASASPIGFELQFSGDHDAPTLRLTNTSESADIRGFGIGGITPNTFDRLTFTALPPGVRIISATPDATDGSRRSDTLGFGLFLDPGLSVTFQVELDPGFEDGIVDYRAILLDAFGTNPNPNVEFIVAFSSSGFPISLRPTDQPVTTEDVYTIGADGDLPPPIIIPEPATLSLAGMGALGLLAYSGRRRVARRTAFSRGP